MAPQQPVVFRQEGGEEESGGGRGGGYEDGEDGRLMKQAGMEKG